MTDGIPPYALIRQNFEFPPHVEDRPLQIEAINELAPLSRTGWWWEVGTGKTFGMTCGVLYKWLMVGSWLPTVVVMPPILTRQWYRWLTSITDRRNGQKLKALEYKGTPRQRRQLDIKRAQFLLMSMQIFKKDFDYLSHQFEHAPVVLMVDEAHSIKNIESHNYRAVRDFSVGRDLELGTATPITKPGDAYAYVKQNAPQVYRNHNHFEALHVGKRDFWGNVTEWANLEMLRENLMINSTRILKREMQPYLKKPIYDPIPYQLDPKHQTLYSRLADEQMLVLEDGGKIDATTENALYQKLQQIVCNPGHFSGDPTMLSAAHELLDETLDQLRCEDVTDGRKLIVFAVYKMTNRGLAEYLKPYNAVAAYGDIPVKRQIDNVEQFINDPETRVLILQPEGGGQGTDGLQKVCSDAFWMEMPTYPKPFVQGVGRIDRDGQQVAPHFRIPIAEGTIQVRLHHNLLKADETVNKVARGFQDLREAIYGAA